MNKNYFFHTIVLSGLLFGACSTKTANPVDNATPVVNEKKMEETAAQKIASALSNNKSVVCEITKKDNSDMMMFEIKGKKSKVSGSSLSGGKGMGYMINDSENVYIWNDADKKGIKMNLKSLESTASAQSQQYSDFTKEDVQKQYEDLGYSYDCRDKDVSDSVFVAPSDVVFSDMSEMMNSVKEMQKNSQAGKTPSPAEINKMMEDAKKYQGN
jgi:hypothetical protein